MTTGTKDLYIRYTTFPCMELSDAVRSLRNCGLDQKEAEDFVKGPGFELEDFAKQEQFLADSMEHPSQPHLEDYFDLSREVNREGDFLFGRNGKIVNSIDAVLDSIFNTKLGGTSLSPAKVLTYIMGPGLIVGGVVSKAVGQSNVFNTLDTIHLSGTVYGVSPVDCASSQVGIIWRPWQQGVPDGATVLYVDPKDPTKIVRV